MSRKKHTHEKLWFRIIGFPVLLVIFGISAAIFFVLHSVQWCAIKYMAYKEQLEETGGARNGRSKKNNKQQKKTKNGVE